MSELIHNLGIEWKVILAQIVNFAILLFILKKFAYGPVVRILNERRRKIEEAIERSKSVDEKMAEIEALKEKVLDRARRESEKIIGKAEQTAKKVQEEILASAHHKSEKFMEETRKKIEAEREKIFQEVKKEIAEVVTLAVEKSVGDLVDRETQEKLVAEALKLVKA
jgi:F-type H+-transporting ATPase subunit b